MWNAKHIEQCKICNMGLLSLLGESTRATMLVNNSGFCFWKIGSSDLLASALPYVFMNSEKSPSIIILLECPPQRIRGNILCSVFYITKGTVQVLAVQVITNLILCLLFTLELTSQIINR